MAARTYIILSSVYFVSVLSAIEGYNNATVLVLPGNRSAVVKTVFFKNQTLITDIDVEEENLPILKSDIFHGLSYLYTIRIQKSNLSTLEEDVFKGLRILKFVNFNFNKIRHVPANVFKNIPVSGVFLKGNGIETLSENAFFNLYNLNTLDLSNNNIELLPKNLFVHTVNVKYLDLSFNKLRHFPAVPYKPYSFFDVAFANATEGENTVLDLSSNNFTFISYYLLRGIRYMDDLRLFNNSVELISEYAFDDFKKVKTLNLYYNNLKEISENLLQVLISVENLKVANNPWKNDFVCVFQDWCEKNKKINYMNLRCPTKTIL